MVEFLKCKIYFLANTKARTGNPNIPPSILRAKIILCDIVKGTDSLSGHPHYAVSDSFLDDSDCDDEEDAEDAELADLSDSAMGSMEDSTKSLVLPQLLIPLEPPPTCWT